jgi:hypothetical protein
MIITGMVVWVGCGDDAELIRAVPAHESQLPGAPYFLTIFASGKSTSA